MNARACFLLLLLHGFVVQGQATSHVRFVPVFGNEALRLRHVHHLADGAPVTIDRLRFYVSHIMFHSQGRTSYADMACHLIDAEDASSLEVALAVPRGIHVDSISFLLGIDSLTNVSGAFGGDLDPTKGMYWTWNSGYINWKLEGMCVKCYTAKNQFEFHLGGYLPPYFNAQRIGFAVPSKGAIEVRVDVAAFLEGSGLGERCAIMSPGKEAVELARVAASVFKPSGRE